MLWMRKRGVVPDSPVLRNPLVAIPNDTCQKTRFAVEAETTLFRGETCLVFIDDDGMDIACEIPLLFESARKGTNQLGGVDEMPGTLLDADEGAYLQRLLAATLYLGWDAYVLDDPGTTLLFLSHDRYCAADALNPVADHKVHKFLSSLPAASEMQPWWRARDPN